MLEGIITVVIIAAVAGFIVYRTKKTKAQGGSGSRETPGNTIEK